MPHHGEPAPVPYVTALPSYTVYLDTGVYYAVNNTTGVLDFNNVDPAVVVQACLTAGGAGCVVGMREGDFVALTGVAATANNQWVYGLGRGSYWDATALLTGVHAFTLDGFTGCTLSEFALETDAGGTLINHCVYIIDGADDFHLHGLTFIDSDTDAIRIEGTTITQGHIHNCHIQGADAYGIRVDMDGGNFMYRLHINDNDIGNCGTEGISFAASAGNLYCQVVNNVVYSCASNGIATSYLNESLIEGNTLLLNGTHGIYHSESHRTQILGNTCLRNVGHGIYAFYSNNNHIHGNICNENDSGDANLYDGISLSQSDQNMVEDNYLMDNDRQGIMIDADSDKNKVSHNYTEGNGAGSIRVNNANCDNNQLEFNTVEEGAPGDVGTLTRSYGNYDPSANAFVGDVGAAPF